MTPREKALELAEDVSFHYFTNQYDKGDAVIALAKDDQYWYYGVSYCSPEDQFVKIEGRGKALTRMLRTVRKMHTSIIATNGFYGYMSLSAPNIHNLKRHELANYILDNCAGRPQWAKHVIFRPRNKFKGPRTPSQSCCCNGQRKCNGVQSNTGGCAG